MAYHFGGYINSEAYTRPLLLGRIVRQKLTAAQAVAATANGIFAAKALPAAATTYTTFDGSMPYARNVTAVCSDTQTGIMVITGSDINDDVITESVTLASAVAVTSTKAFKTVTSIRLPIKVGVETINVGWGDKIAVPFKLRDAADRPVVEATLAGVIETTAPTLTASVTDLAKNLIDLDSALNGSEVCIYYYV